MKEKFRKKIIGSCMVIVCLVAVLLVKGMLIEASGTTSEEIQLVTIENYTSTALETEIESQRANNYLYAGLYKSGTTVENLVAKNVVVESKVTEGSTYVAKFVPEGVMGIKAQVSEALLSNPEATTSSVRFVTAVDSVLYKEVGFYITRENPEGGDPINLVKEGTISKYVYEKLYGVDVTSANPGEPLEYTPKDIHALASYFKTYTITNVPEEAYNKDLTVTPYWITYDGETVKGTTGIKSVNFGRSWVYINTTTHTDGAEYGTYDHPFTDLADALDAIVLENNGQIVIQSSCANSTFTVPSGFTWSEHEKDLTVTGEGEKTETLDFSAITNFRIGDSVTFENMTLNLPTDQLYCNGHRFQVSENVISDNSGLIIFGGDNSSDVTGDTNIILLSGKYERVYGGGLNKDVHGDTHVTIRNVDIYDTSSNNKRFVFGGGRNANVHGNTYVTVGEGFNSEHAWNSHSYLSAVFGGGHGSTGDIAIVEKDTYVVIEDGAKTNYVHGAGMEYSEVKGTSHVTFDGGYAMSIYGGGSSIQATSGNTFVVMKSGTVEQIFGGNPNNSSLGMTGNADVHILGGNILRRVYGGCYNEYGAGWETTNEVNGYVSVTFGPDTYASLAASYSGGDCAYLASSRYPNTTNETGVFVVNDYDVTDNATNVGLVGHSTSFTTIKAYNYLVKAYEGGAVYSEGDSLRVIPDENKVATVRINDAEAGVGTVHAYITSEGVCKLPELDSSGKTNVFVVFTDEAPSDVTVSDYEATANGTHYATLEEAISVANTLSIATEKEVVVNLLQANITVDTTLNIEDSAKIKIQNADGVTATVNRADELNDSSLLNVASGAELTVDGIILDGRKSSEINAGTTTLTSLQKGSASLVTVEGEVTLTDTIIQYTYTSKEGAGVYISNNGKVAMTDGEISNNYVDGNSGGAISVYLGTFTMDNGTISNNTASASGGAFMVRNGSTLTINGGTISNNKAKVTGDNGGGAIFAHRNTTVNITGGIIDNNSATAGNGGAILAFETSVLTIKNATVSNNTSGSEKNGGAVYVAANAELTLEGGATFSNNTADANGGAIAVLGTVTEKEGTSCTFTENTAVNGGAIYVSGTCTMAGSTIDSNTASYGGAVCIDGAGSYTMSGGSITANTASGNGSGVYAKGTDADTIATFTMSGGSISGHGTADEPKSVVGNAVRIAEYSTFNMTGTADISSNYSKTTGNGVRVDENGSFIMSGGTIQNNHTTGTGSGVEVKGSFAMSAGTITENTAGGSAGGVIIRDTGTFSMTGGTIEENTADTNGGGLYIQVSSNNVALTGGNIVGNTAINGGGIYVSCNKTVTMSDVIIRDNTATGNGGGICVNTAAGCILTSGTISENNAINGGGVYTENKGKFTMEGGSITTNEATACGSGVYVGTATDDKLFTMSGGTISGHGSAEQANNTEGAGVYVASTAKFNLSGGSICDNYSTLNGAGVATYGTFNMSGTSTIQNNVTTSNGGGVYVGDGTYTLNNGTEQTVYNNQAANGGGVSVVGTFNFKKGNITGNTATTSGGGVYVDGGAFAMTDAASEARVISSNTAATYGAGVYLNNGTFDMNAGSICNHGEGSMTAVTTAGAKEGAGVCAAGTSVVTMSGGSISYNYVTGSGAGISIRDTAKFIMDGGTVSYNTAKASGGGMIVRSTRTETIDDVATAVATFVMNDGTISYNSALESSTSNYNGGGAIFQVSNTFVSINKGDITENKAVNKLGGAINMAESAKLEVVDGNITSNYSKGNGGAIYAAKSNILLFTGNGNISGNTSSETVQGVFVQNAYAVSQVTLHTTFTMENEIRYNNLSTRGTDNPVLIIKGSITAEDDYSLNLGFHKTATVYIQCDDVTTAATIFDKMTFFKTTNCEKSHEDGSNFIAINVKQ